MSFLVVRFLETGSELFAEFLKEFKAEANRFSFTETSNIKSVQGEELDLYDTRSAVECDPSFSLTDELNLFIEYLNLPEESKIWAKKLFLKSKKLSGA